MTHKEIAAAFNEWYHTYTRHPDKFFADFQTAVKFLAQEARGEIPTYGEQQAATLEFYHRKLSGAP